MSKVTPIRHQPRRLDNPESHLGRTYMVLRDASYWLDLQEIQSAIEARFGEQDSIPMIRERIAELIRRGEMIETRIPLGGSGREYMMLGEFPGGGAA